MMMESVERVQRLDESLAGSLTQGRGRGGIGLARTKCLGIGAALLFLSSPAAFAQGSAQAGLRPGSTNVLSGVSGPVGFSGFADERGRGRNNTVDTSSVPPAPYAAAASPAAAPPAAVAAVHGQGRVRGFVNGQIPKTWDATAGDLKGALPLPAALARLSPPGSPALGIDGPSNLMDIQVKWASTKMTRADALKTIAADYGLRIDLGEKTVKVSPMMLAEEANRNAAMARAQAGQGASRSAGGVEVRGDAPSPQRYDVRIGDIKLATSFARWASQSGVRLRWDAEKHVLVGAPMTFNATDPFDAISQALSTPGIINSEYPLEACEYPNTPRLIRVTRLGDQAKECAPVVSQSPEAAPSRSAQTLQGRANNPAKDIDLRF